MKKIIWDWELILKQKVLKEKLKQHWLTLDDIIWLDKEIKQPILIYESWTKAKSRVIVTNISKGKDKIAVAVWLDRKWSIAEINEVTSIHPKDINRYLNEKNSWKINKVEFEDTKKSKRGLAQLLSKRCSPLPESDWTLSTMINQPLALEFDLIIFQNCQKSTKKLINYQKFPKEIS